LERLTKGAPGEYRVEPHAILPREDGFGGAAIEKLARMENLYEDLCRQQERITAEMEALRAEGKQKTMRFRQLLANKVTNNNVMVMLEMHP
jgi:hypothetical protein